MVRFLGRRAVSGAISGMFVVLIFVAAVSALLAYNTSLDRYNQAVSERNRMEWERLNEKITIPYAERLSDGTLNATIQNIGAVTAHLVGLWLSSYDNDREPKWQQQYSLDIWISPGETKTNFGQNTPYYKYTLIKPNQVSEPPFIELQSSGWIYTIKIVTERGNTAVYHLIPPPPVGAVGGGGGYPLIIVADHYNFQYMDKKTADKSFKSAYIKKSSSENDHPLYRILLNNTTNMKIILYKNSTMLQIGYGGGSNVIVRYIVSNLTNIQNNTPTKFSSQTINPGGSQYVYFATQDIENPSWVGDPTGGGSSSPYYMVGFLIVFRYEGESEVRSISLPALIQKLE